MENHDGEIHVETDDARGGSTPNIVRWILLISLFGAIALLSIIWITGAATQDDDQVGVTTQRDGRVELDATDSIAGENADELEAAEPGDDAAAAPTEDPGRPRIEDVSEQPQAN